MPAALADRRLVQPRRSLQRQLQSQSNAALSSWLKILGIQKDLTAYHSLWGGAEASLVNAGGLEKILGV